MHYYVLLLLGDYFHDITGGGGGGGALDLALGGAHGPIFLPGSMGLLGRSGKDDGEEDTRMTLEDRSGTKEVNPEHEFRQVYFLKDNDKSDDEEQEKEKRKGGFFWSYC